VPATVIMKIAVPKERHDYERRVAVTPETAERYVALGIEVSVESTAGDSATFSDEAYRSAGAEIEHNQSDVLRDADIVLKVQRPLDGTNNSIDELSLIKPGAILLGLLSPSVNSSFFRACATARITAMALEYLPRISRAQSMDALSSQSNLAGYKAVLDATTEFGRALPMMMTAAGTIAPAKAFVLGAGVAGLQAIATARRLGAIVSAFDVRPEVQEQIESLGARFVSVPLKNQDDVTTNSGYAREMSSSFQQKQAEVTHETLKSQDLVICTALIPGRPAPILITEEMVKDMKRGSVIVDLAVETGGNCDLSQAGEIISAHGVRIIAHPNVPSRIAVDASALYAKNLFNVVSAFYDKTKNQMDTDLNDEILSAITLTHDGSVVNSQIEKMLEGED